MAYATTDDVSARRPGGLTGDELDRAAALLEDAAGVIELAAGRSVPVPTPAVVKMLTCRLVLRSLDNPAGIASESIGDYSYRRTREAQAGMGLTAGERKMLRQAVGAPLTASAPIGHGITPEAVRWTTPVGEEHWFS